MNEKLFYKKILNYAKRLKAIEFLGGRCKICGNEEWYNLDFHHVKKKRYILSVLLNGGYRWSLIENELKKCELLCGNCHQEKHFIERNSTDNRQISKKIYLSYKGDICEECGYNVCAASLTFHHKDPSIKKIKFADINERINSIEELKLNIQKELDECRLLCTNCHRKEHADIEFFENNKKLILEKMKNMKELNEPIDVNVVINMYESGIKQIDICKKLNASKGGICGVIKKYYENKIGHIV